MRQFTFVGDVVLVMSALMATATAQADDAQLGIFERHADIGTTLHAGPAKYDATAKTYSLTGSGENMWFAKDAFHFAWKQVTGDVSIAADLSCVGNGKDPRLKAYLMIPHGPDPDPLYGDVI